MPHSITFTLHTRGQSLPENAIPALHATFFQWLERGDAATAQRVHDVSDPKAYTISPLTLRPSAASAAAMEALKPPPLRVTQGRPAAATGTATFRITLLDDTLREPLERGIASKPEVRILWATLPLAESPRIEQRTYTHIAQGANDRANIILHFDSPTSFYSHEMHYPLPDPILVFASYQARWNAFAPEPLQISAEWLEWVQESVAVARLEIRSELMKFKGYMQVGFMGRVQFSVMPNAPDREGYGPLNALADYACFCGTGHKTTQGMGQTRRVVAWSDGRTVG